MSSFFCPGKDSGMTKQLRWVLSALLFLSGLVVSTGASSTEGELATSGEKKPAAMLTPPEDPLFPQDISAWTYTPEFAERFKRMKLEEPGPTGAYAVNFQVHQVDELDRCVFNVFLDNTLPIDYPEGPVGFLSFTYPMSWFFLKLSPADQQAVDAAYAGKYREPRAFLTHGSGEETLTYFQNRTILYKGVAVVTLTVRCDHVAVWQNPLRLRLRTTSGMFHEVGLPDHLLGWIHATLTKWRRPEAKPFAEGLADHNIWSYTPEFANRFGLPALDEPGPTGAQAVAWRVERYEQGNYACLMDLYLDDTIPIRLPESESSYLSAHPGLGYLLTPKDKADSQYYQSWAMAHGKIFDTELFVIRELKTEGERNQFPDKEHMGGNMFRIRGTTPLHFQQHRKHAMPSFTYVALYTGCEEPSVGNLGPTGIAIIKNDGGKHEILLPAAYTEQVHRQWRERIDIPFRCRYPKLYPGVHCTK